MVIHLISGPRNISTALMYSFAQRGDMKVMDEPFYAFYLILTGLEHPGKDEILKTLEPDPKKVFTQIKSLEQKHGNVFIKNMGHHLQGFDYSSIVLFQNVFLIRDPGQMLLSYAKVREQPTLNDIGLKQQAELFAWLQAEGQQPIVLDGNELRKNPSVILEKLCEQLGLPFTKAMLSWPAGPRAEDGCWAPYWYTQVHQSTNFMPPEPDTTSLPNYLLHTYEEALPYYTTLKNYALKA
ncbi:sulfotransferase family protein [Adhaeribacter arboris]|uniref:Sulfotransferase family protein n=1 Tax=Adhaeribacter arboris TaxID=2072846 RepID=A0A2T2YB83_9BACT|nr:sulfotransferase family protein [Adhaeribacter arboris]PSR52772.1 sulfotransferase family protein [Adhaeribacter arboris]